jgi:beta-galactosidase
MQGTFVPKLRRAVLGLVFLCVLPTLHAAGREKVNFSDDWRFSMVDDAGLESSDYQGTDRLPVVNLPHTWNAKDIFGAEPYHRGVGWYRKDFEVPTAWAGKRIVLRFEAASQVATVWVNGVLIGNHKGAFTPFQFDITRLVRPGEKNLVAVQVDNRWRRDVAPLSTDFNVTGGLYREAWLIATSQAYIVSTRVTTPRVSNSEGTAAFEIEIRNSGDTEIDAEAFTDVFAPDGAKLPTLSSPVKLKPGASVVLRQQTDIRNPQLWSPDEPKLYRASFSLRKNGMILDDDSVELGFRWYRFDAEKGFFLNGQPLKLKGVNREQDFPGMGWAVPAALHVKDMELIKQMGANFVRLSVYPQDPSVLEACDQIGLMVWEEVPLDGERGEVASLEGATDYTETIKQMAREMIQRDRNHPSIILWSLGNENLNGPTVTEWRAVAKVTRELNAVAKAEDPTRPTTVAFVGDLLYRAEEVGMIDMVDVVGCNVYSGWYRGKFEDLGEIIDSFHQKHPNKALIISEYGAGMKLGQHTEQPQRFDFSEEWGCLFHESYLKQINDRPFLAGGTIWVAFDFGSQDRRTGPIPYLNEKGVYDFYRQPKDVFYLYASQWTRKPMVYIVSHTWTERFGKPGESKSIKVYSNCDRVELFLNGKSLGVKGQRFVWDVEFQSGDNQLRAVGRNDAEQVVDSMTVKYY